MHPKLRSFLGFLRRYWREIAVALMFLVLNGEVREARRLAEYAWDEASAASEYASYARDYAADASDYASEAASYSAEILDLVY